ncbi:uncharacterized protein LOC123398131 [Hordeum vulgare subsp. vulgare]|uniref:uncharacterized protein LOC123398131 n=1 Tax=Hordeum vulgare subsp. vulgare TaxID=112509 RepID=UPI001D1A594D|nr:uncharacterized protein LOC123398131 [Hordeum vulgare subsp. vulgare]
MRPLPGAGGHGSVWAGASAHGTGGRGHGPARAGASTHDADGYDHGLVRGVARVTGAARAAAPTRSCAAACATRPASGNAISLGVRSCGQDLKNHSSSARTSDARS